MPKEMHDAIIHPLPAEPASPNVVTSSLQFEQFSNLSGLEVCTRLTEIVRQIYAEFGS